MKQVQRIVFLFLIAFFCFFSGIPRNANAEAGTAYDMINGVNELRAANGMTPYVINGYLMASAQAHADWITETGQGGHIGIGGSYAVDRAIAAGYGDGASVLVNENWAQGYNLSVYDCIYVSWNDSDHMGNMLSPYHYEIGAGVSIANNIVTYVINIGHVIGSAPPEQLPTSVLTASMPYVPPIVTSTSNPDGSIYHTVKEGEFLINIASAYNISLDELLLLNNLTMDSIILAGDILIIRNAEIPTETPTLENTPTPFITLKPSITPRASYTPVISETVPSVQKEDGFIKRIFSENTRYVGIGLLAISVISLILLIISAARIK